MKALGVIWRQRRGAASLLAAALLTSVIGAGMSAVELTDMTRTRSALQKSADAAALAATQSPAAMETRRDIAADILSANIEGLRLGTPDVGYDPVPGEPDRYLLRVSAAFHGRLAGLLGDHAPRLAVETLVEGRVGVPSTMGDGASDDVRIALAIDVSGSMIRWFADNPGAVADVMDTLEALGEAYERGASVSVVPFSDRVRVDPSRTDWVTGAPPGWDGCVDPRHEVIDGNPHALTDAPPDSVPFLPFDVDALPLSWQSACPNTAIMGPGADISQMSHNLENWRRRGSGRFDVGLAWGWRALSPRWDTVWDANPPVGSIIEGDGDETANRTLILVTDGYTEGFYNDFGDDGYLGHNRGTTYGFDRMVELCARIRAQDIRIVTLFINGNELAEPYLRRCVGDNGLMLGADSAQELENALLSMAPRRAARILR